MTTKAEKEWMDCIVQIGCLVCLLFENAPETPGCPHHLLTDGGRRRGHLDTICLCDPGHHQNAPAGTGKISRHPNKARFEQAYGTEEELLVKSRKLVEIRFGLFIGVDIDSVHHKLAVKKEAA